MIEENINEIEMIRWLLPMLTEEGQKKYKEILYKLECEETIFT